MYRPQNPNSLTAPATTGAITTYYIQFEVTNQAVTLVSTDVFPASAGQSTTLEILQELTTFNVINTIPFTSTIASDGTTPQTVPINMLLTPGTYRMRISGGNYYRNYQSNAVFPYSIPNFSITTGSNVASDSYYFMYNLKVNSGCESPRTMVTATVDVNCLSTSEVKARDMLKVYPNPFTDVIYIDRPEMVRSVQVTDVSGKLIRNNIQPGSVVRLNDLPQGLYILILDMKDGSKQSIKAIKK
ncbi:T9SS type A sorting domain-containing protein [Chryseobacterium wanjuense]